MAKPPSDAPVLFDVQGDSSTIKQRKDGSYKLVVEGVEKVHWKTKGDDVEEGYRNAASYVKDFEKYYPCLLYTSPSPRDRQKSRMPSSA